MQITLAHEEFNINVSDNIVIKIFKVSPTWTRKNQNVTNNSSIDKNDAGVLVTSLFHKREEIITSCEMENMKVFPTCNINE